MNVNATLTQHDSLLYRIILAHLPVTAFLVPMGYGTSQFALIASAALGIVATAAYLQLRGTRAFGIIAGVALMTLSAIMIQSQLGRIEMHFHIFSALALLLIYRNWLPIVVAAGTIAVHHLALTALQLDNTQFSGMAVMVFSTGCSWNTAFVHAAFVVVETGALVYYALLMRRDEQTSNSLIDAISEVSGNKDLTIRIEGSSHPVAASFNELMQRFGDFTREMAAVGEQLSASASQMGESASRANNQINMQHSQTEEIAAAISQMSNTIQMVSELTKAAEQNAQQSNTQAVVGVELFRTAQECVTELEKIMETASRSINKLETDAESISSVVDVIRDISDQTNLLALNATIEAARAGEHGRGFAVVAEEVRTLAQKTQESTEKIHDIVSNLQTDTGASVQRITSGQSKSADAARKVDSAGELLTEILASLEEIYRSSQQVASSSQEQTMVASSINDGINQISEASVEIVNDANHNARSAEELTKLAGAVRNLVADYRF